MVWISDVHLIHLLGIVAATRKRILADGDQQLSILSNNPPVACRVLNIISEIPQRRHPIGTQIRYIHPMYALGFIAIVRCARTYRILLLLRLPEKRAFRKGLFDKRDGL
ncbi:MAG: hypothetical protein ACYC0Z_09695, partial [Acidobacteriaceae bacterium]